MPQLFTGAAPGSTQGPSLCGVGVNAATYLPNASTTCTILPGLPINLNVASFVFANTTRLHLCEGTNVTLMTYDFNGTTWLRTGNTKISPSVLWSMTGRLEAGAFILYATNATSLLAYNTATSVLRIVASAPASMVFQGVVPAPYDSTFLPPSGSSASTPSGTSSGSITPSSSASPSQTMAATGTPTASQSKTAVASKVRIVLAIAIANY